MQSTTNFSILRHCQKLRFCIDGKARSEGEEVDAYKVELQAYVGFSNDGSCLESSSQCQDFLCPKSVEITVLLFSDSTMHYLHPFFPNALKRLALDLCPKPLVSDLLLYLIPTKQLKEIKGL